MNQEKKRIFLICSRDPLSTQVKGGGTHITMDNLTCLKSFGEVDIFPIVYEQEGMFISRLYFLLRLLFLPFGYTAGLFPWHLYMIKKKLKKNNYDLVFIDHSRYGSLTSLIRKNSRKAKIFTQFHNFELKYIHQAVIAPKWIKWLMIVATKRNEKKALMYSDVSLCLNRRDFEEIKLFYKKSPSYVLPISLEDRRFEFFDNSQTTFEEIKVNSLNYAHPLLLFCGSYFQPNIDGILWFINNVLDKVPGTLMIIGYKMENLSLHSFNTNRVINLGTVENLSPFYKAADLVICPSFLGSGIKTKTIESFMYGKITLGTTDAFQGFPQKELPIPPCKNAEDFIKKIHENINRQDLQMLSEKYRMIYEKYFSRKEKINKLSSLLNT